MKVLVSTSLVVLFLTTPGLAQNDEADVNRAVLDFYARLNAADATYISFWHTEATSYARAGGILGSDVGMRSESAIQAAFDAGLEYRVTVGSLETKVFGGISAISTFYTGGLVRNPTGTNVEGGTFRATMVWTKEGEEWRIVHLHISPLG